MKETIRQLFYGNIFPSERCGNGKEEVKTLARKIGEKRELLCQGLTEEQKKILEEYDDLLAELHSFFNEEFFVDGFSLGAKFIKEAIEWN